MASKSVFGHSWFSLNLLNMPSIRVALTTFCNLSSPLPSAWGYLFDEKSFCLTLPEAISRIQSKLLSWFIHINLYWHFTEHMSRANSQHIVLLQCRKKNRRSLWANEHDSINQMLFWLVLRCFSRRKVGEPACHSGASFPPLLVRQTPEWCQTVRCKQLATTLEGYFACQENLFTFDGLIGGTSRYLFQSSLE